MEKTVELEYEGKMEEFIFQEMSTEKFAEFQDRCTDQNLMGRVQTMRINLKNFRLLGIFYSLKKAPFPVTVQNIGNLPKKLGVKLFSIAEELNDLNEKNSQSSEVSPTEEPQQAI